MQWGYDSTTNAADTHIAYILPYNKDFDICVGTAIDFGDANLTGICIQTGFKTYFRATTANFNSNYMGCAFYWIAMGI